MTFSRIYGRKNNVEKVGLTYKLHAFQRKKRSVYWASSIIKNNCGLLSDKQKRYNEIRRYNQKNNRICHAGSSDIG